MPDGQRAKQPCMNAVAPRLLEMVSAPCDRPLAARKLFVETRSQHEARPAFELPAYPAGSVS